MSYLHRLGPVTIFFGLPGAGKSCHAAYIYRKLHRKYTIYSNFPIVGAFPIDIEHLGVMQLKRPAIVILDEAGLCLNNRNFKGLSKNAISFFKLCRHYGVKIVLYSQAYDDMDITVRRLAGDWYLLKRSLIPGFSLCQRIHRRIGVDDQDHQVKDLYEMSRFLLFTSKRFFRPLCYRYFDSYAAPELEPYDPAPYTSKSG